MLLSETKRVPIFYLLSLKRNESRSFISYLLSVLCDTRSCVICTVFTVLTHVFATEISSLLLNGEIERWEIIPDLFSSFACPFTFLFTERVCPSVRRSVGPSVRRSVRNAFFSIGQKGVETNEMRSVMTRRAEIIRVTTYFVYTNLLVVVLVVI